MLHLLIVKHPEVLFGQVFFRDASIPHRIGKESACDSAHSKILHKIYVGPCLVQSHLLAVIETERKRHQHRCDSKFVHQRHLAVD